MGLKSKQLSDFNDNIDWTSASSSEIPNSRDVMNYFLPESSMIYETFVNQTISSSTNTWSLTLTYNIQDDNIEFVVLYINGLKTDSVISAIGNLVTFDQLAYDMDIGDKLEVHYIKSHSV